MSIHRSNPIRIAGVRLLPLLAGLALAATLTNATVITEPPMDDRAPLSGPDVRDERNPDVDSRFTEGGINEKRRRSNFIPPKAYREILESLEGDSAPDGIRLSPEQREKVHAILADATRELGGPRRGEPKPAMDGEDRGPEAMGGPGGPDQRPDRPSREPRGDGPRRPVEGDSRRLYNDAQEQIWAILNESQRAHVQEKIDAVRHEQEKRRADDYVERRLKKQGRPPEAGEPGMRPPGPGADGRRGPGGPGEGPGGERLQRLMRVLGALPPDVRRDLVDRFEREVMHEAREHGVEVDGPRGPNPPGKGPKPGKGPRGRGPGPQEPRDDRRDAPPPPPPADR